MQRPHVELCRLSPVDCQGLSGTRRGTSLAFSLQTADGIIDDVAGLTAFLDERLPREEPGKETGTAGAKSNSFAVADLWRTLIDLEEEFVPSATIGDKLAETRDRKSTRLNASH